MDEYSLSNLLIFVVGFSYVVNLLPDFLDMIVMGSLNLVHTESLAVMRQLAWLGPILNYRLEGPP